MNRDLGKVCQPGSYRSCNQPHKSEEKLSSNTIWTKLGKRYELKRSILVKMRHEDNQSLYIKNSNCVKQIGVTLTTVDYAGMLSSKGMHLHATTFVLFLVLKRKRYYFL